MNYKKVLLYGCVFGLIAFGASYKWWYPTIRNTIQEYARTQVKAEMEEMYSVKATRDIPEDVDLGSFLAGRFAKESGAYQNAADYYVKVIEKDPTNMEIKSELFLLYAITGQIEKAIGLIDEIKGTEPDVFITKQLQTAGWIKNGDYQKVIDFYHNNQQSSSDIILKPLLLAWSYAGLKQQDQAYASLEAIKDKRLNSIKLYHKALLASYFGNDLEARNLYQQFEPEEIASANTLVSLAAAFRKTNEWVPGNIMYDKYLIFLRQKPVLFDIITQVGTAQIQTPQHAVADAYYTVALSFADLNLTERAVLLNNIARYLDDESNLYKIGTAELYQNMDMRAIANDIYDSIKPSSDIIQFKKAINLLAMHKYETALPLLQKLEPRNKTNPLVQQIIADAYRGTGRFKQAIKHLNISAQLLEELKRNTEVSNVYLSIAEIHHMQKNESLMFDALEKAIKADMDNAHALNFIGYELIDRNINLARGLSLVIRAHQILPEEPHIIDSVAWGYYKQKDYPKALLYAEKAVNKLKGSAVVLLHLGDIYHAMGREREAESQYRKALAMKYDMTPEIKAELKQKLGEEDSQE